MVLNGPAVYPGTCRYYNMEEQVCVGGWLETVLED